jgi:hypothetical protein
MHDMNADCCGTGAGSNDGGLRIRQILEVVALIQVTKPSKRYCVKRICERLVLRVATTCVAFCRKKSSRSIHCLAPSCLLTSNSVYAATLESAIRIVDTPSAIASLPWIIRMARLTGIYLSLRHGSCAWLTMAIVMGGVVTVY